MLRPILAPMLALAVGALAAVTLATTAHAQPAKPIKRVDRPTTTISNLVAVPPGYETIYISGTTSGSGGTPTPAGADTEAQAAIIYEKFKTWLEGEGLTMSDIVMMRVYLVADATKGGKMDTAGANAAYNKFFGVAAQPNKPARLTVQVAGLGGTALVEIEATAAKRR